LTTYCVINAAIIHRWDSDINPIGTNGNDDDAGLPPGVDPLLFPHGRLWTGVAGTVYDERNNGRFTNSTRILWNQNELLKEPLDRQPIDYLMKVFPPKLVKLMVDSTNDRMRKRGLNCPVTAGEIYQYLGIRLGMALEPRKGGLKAYWMTSMDQHGFSQGANYQKRTGMSFSRFDNINSNLAFCPHHDGIRENEVRSFLHTPLMNSLTNIPSGRPLEGRSANYRPFQRLSRKHHLPW
jgi:hypothetical protein